MTLANIPPTLVNNSNKIRVGCLVLNLRHLIDMRFRRISEHVIQIGNHRGVTQPGESVSASLQISGESGVLMNQKQPRSLLFALRKSNVTRNSVLVLF